MISNQNSKTFSDFDYAGCYSTAASIVPKIDTNGDVREYKAALVIDADTERELLKEGVAPGLIRKLKSHLRKGEESFRKKLARMKNRNLAMRIRQRCERCDNTLVEDWVSRCRQASADMALIPGFAKVRFHFPDSCNFPCLPDPHEKYGLIYALQGECCVTATEVVLAVEAGAKIECLWAVELPVEKDSSGRPKRLIQDHIATALQTRKEYARMAKAGDCTSMIFERLTKEFVNSLYGKYAQGINIKNTTDDATGLSEKMPPSKITEACIATLVTGFARAALSAALLAIDRFNQGKSRPDQIDIASCTTDGFLIGIPSPEGYSVVGDYYQLNTETNPQTGEVTSSARFVNKPTITEFLSRFGYEGLLKFFDQFLPLKQMRQARLDIVGEDDYLEIKHLSDYLISVKTRGQLGFLYSGDCTILARFGHKVPLCEEYDDPEQLKWVMNAGGSVRDTADAKWLCGKIAKAATGGIVERYNKYTLETFKSILESDGGKDLTCRISHERINTDFDWRRDMVWSDANKTKLSPYTIPHKSRAIMVRKRSSMEKIRRRGESAPTVKVMRENTVKEQTIRRRDGIEATLVRELLRAVVQGKVKAILPTTGKQCAEALNVVWQELGLNSGKKKTWSYHDINNAKRPRGVEPGVFQPEPGLLTLVDRLCEIFQCNGQQAHELLFSADLFQYHLAPIARDVVTAILNGPCLQIAPFPELSEAGLLPTRSHLEELFGHLVQEIDLLPFDAFPNKRPVEDRQMLTNLFRRAGLNAPQAKLATASIVPAVKPKQYSRHNPSTKRCLERFVQALHQPDMTVVRPPTKAILHKLELFGLTKSTYYRIRDEKFVAHDLRRSSENRYQIKRMAKDLGLDSERFIRELLG